MKTKDWIILIIVLIYIISPIDLMPGVPVDDIIVAIVGALISYNTRGKKWVILNDSHNGKTIYITYY